MALALSGCQSATDSCGTTELWYAQPAKVWMESLPIGNVRLGNIRTLSASLYCLM